MKGDSSYSVVFALVQMFLQPGTSGLSLGSVQLAHGTTMQPGGALTMHGQVVSAGSLQGSTPQQHTVQQQPQQQSQPQQQNLLRDTSSVLSQSSVRSTHSLPPQQSALPASLYNTMMISQPNQANVVQIATSLAQNSSNNTAAMANFAQDRSGQIRYTMPPTGYVLLSLSMRHTQWLMLLRNMLIIHRICIHFHVSV
jgi:circadian locomoter output cycle kaput protein